MPLKIVAIAPRLPLSRRNLNRGDGEAGSSEEEIFKNLPLYLLVSPPPCLFSSQRRRRQGAGAAEGLVKDDGHSVGEIQGAHRPQRRDAECSVGIRVEEIVGQAGALLSEDERVAGTQAGVEVRPRSDRAEEPEARGR